MIRGGCGPGKNTYLYTVSGKKKGLNRFESPKDDIAQNPIELERNRSGSKLSHKEGQAKIMRDWNHYNSNMNSYLVEQRKILYSKNYELDSRAWGLKDYGV